MEIESEQENIEYKCDICDYRTNFMNNLKKNNGKHNNTKKRKKVIK